ncbi:hypothetical protein [Neisseria sp.]|uniref:hypothetical protein n=1 Tax=Neisseria sp. TaxID=192066 RepID=UPI0035A17657
MNKEVEHLIAETFRLTGVRLSEDDPVVAVLLMQQDILDTALEEFGQKQDASREVFLRQLSEHEANITKAAAALEHYREQILAGLLVQVDEKNKDAVNKIYAAVQGRLIRDLQTSNAELTGRLKMMLTAVSAGWLLSLVLAVWFCLNR